MQFYGMQAEFFGLSLLADKAYARLNQPPRMTVGDDVARTSFAGNIEYDSVYVETGFHSSKGDSTALQQQQDAIMQVQSTQSPLHTCSAAAV